MQRRETSLRLLTKVAAILLSIWTIVAIVIWMVVRSMDEALLGRSPSVGDGLAFFAIPAVGWVLVCAVWVITEKPWRTGHFSNDDDGGKWVGNTYIPERDNKG